MEVRFQEWLKSASAKSISLAAVSEIPAERIDAVLKLCVQGATIPFIARYRKEATGGLDEVAVGEILEAKERFDTLVKRKKFICERIEGQKKLTSELKSQILAAFDLQTLEDLYLPYKQKRKTKATKAREAGLEPLADWISDCARGVQVPQPGQTLELWALTYRNDEHGVTDAALAISGAQDILVERLAEVAPLRVAVRSSVFEKGAIRTEKGSKASKNGKYEKYFAFEEKITTLLEPRNSHRYLALRRGWMEEQLKVSIVIPEDEQALLLEAFCVEAGLKKSDTKDDPSLEMSNVVTRAATIAFKAHVLTSIENEVHSALKTVADETAISVFSENLRKLLLAAPFGAKGVLGIDPGVRTGCKLALVDEKGQFVGSTVIHLATEKEREQAAKSLIQILERAQVKAVAIGNGTAGRETELFVRGALKAASIDIPVVMVSEAGASVYSASEAAREEFPDIDLTVRGAISIARRLQDPLAELVKVEPKSIGVGQYQHDVSAVSLKKSLAAVVESCVNQVGVNLNTASRHLLAYVAGIGPALAQSITQHRAEKGLFRTRGQLMDVPKFSKTAFEQSAGFLRVFDGDHPLDKTGVHPERYEALEELASRLNKSLGDLLGDGVKAVKDAANTLVDTVGKFTFEDIVSELEKRGRDPRSQFVAFNFRDDIHEVKDLKLGMSCPGIVTNVTNFGAFVDIGVHQDGLVHISQLADRFVKDPRDAVSPGDRVQVRVLEVNLEKKQIALTMRAQKPATTSVHKRGEPPQNVQGAKASKGIKAPSQKHRHPPQVGPVGAKGKSNSRSPRPKIRPPKRGFNTPFAGLAEKLKGKGK